MALVVILGRFTDQGLRKIKDFPAVVTAALQNFPSGVKLIGDLYVTQGRYDLVGVVECPNLEDALQLVAQNSARGNVRWETMSAVTIGRFGELMGANEKQAGQPRVTLVKDEERPPEGGSWNPT